LAREKGDVKRSLAIVIPMLIGVGVGLLCSVLAIRVLPADSGDQAYFFTLALLMAFLVLAMWMHTILHEAGHLLFGLLTGYRFCSFRIGRLMITKQDGKLRVSSMTIAGTGGQCLLTPPEMKDGKTPFMLYNLGGVLVNVITAALALLIYAAMGMSDVWSLFPVMFAIVGFATGLMNGIPLMGGPVYNDGANTVAMMREPTAVDALRKQLLINERVTAGVRLKDMPDEWFTLTGAVKEKNPLTSAIDVFRASRLLDAHDLEAAQKAGQQLLDESSGLAGLHKAMVAVDAAYLALVVNGNAERAEELLDKPTKKVMKAMATNPSVIRTEYALAMLAAHDEKAAQAALERFEKAAKQHPYACEIESERELLAIVDEKAGKSA